MGRLKIKERKGYNIYSLSGTTLCANHGKQLCNELPEGRTFSKTPRRCLNLWYSGAKYRYAKMTFPEWRLAPHNTYPPGSGSGRGEMHPRCLDIPSRGRSRAAPVLKSGA